MESRFLFLKELSLNPSYFVTPLPQIHSQIDLSFQVRNCMDPEIILWADEIFRNQKAAQITTIYFTKLPS